jgi:DNA mismatch repair protein MutS2
LSVELYPSNFTEKIGYTAVVARAATYCVGERGREELLALTPSARLDDVLVQLQRVKEMTDMLVGEDPLPFRRLPYVEPLFARAAIDNYYLLEEDFFALSHWLATVKAMYAYFHSRRAKYPALAELIAGPKFDVRFADEIDAVIGPEGKMLSHASAELLRLREAVVEKSGELRRIVQQILRQARNDGMTDARELTVRNDRLVIPIHAEAKNKIKGFVHDVSASGQTIYLEPVQALGLNNEIRELKLKERNEILRILTELTARLRPLLPEFRRYSDFLTAVDVLRAKAKLGLELGATVPLVRPDNGKGVTVLNIENGRHPLLVLQKGKSAVAPLNLRLDSHARIVVVSGPNAGGKTVAMQTVGLLQLMVQSGLPVPVGDGSVFPVFERMFMDMGDDQSLQNDLSTYTSHLGHMRYMLERMNRRTLFLIDEFGSGTDPLLGGPIAEAILERFVHKRGMGVITTHYSNLKDFAQHHPNCSNAAMRFDLDTLAPSYVLEQGIPGASYALEIAARAGIPPEVLTAAKAKIGVVRTDVERLLADLRQKQTTLEAQSHDLAHRLKNLEKREKIVAEAENARKTADKEAEAKRAKLIKEAKEEAARLLAHANARIEATIRKIRESKADKEQTRRLRKELEQELAVVSTQPSPPPFDDQPDENFEPGDAVRLPDGFTVGTVLEVRDKIAVVAVGELKTTAKRNELVKTVQRENNVPAPSVSSTLDRAISTPRELDVRGKRVEEALPETTRFLDDAVVAGLSRVFILHGKGAGILKNALWRYIKESYPQVKKLHHLPDDEGGTGVTVCVFE